MEETSYQPPVENRVKLETPEPAPRMRTEAESQPRVSGPEAVRMRDLNPAIPTPRIKEREKVRLPEHRLVKVDALVKPADPKADHGPKPTLAASSRVDLSEPLQESRPRETRMEEPPISM